MRLLKRLYGGLSAEPGNSMGQFYPRILSFDDGTSFDCSSLAGKVVLIVNTASQCGFTKQYDALEELYKRYQAQGLEVLGCPSNDFGQQEPGDDTQIIEFCRINHGVTFRLLPKGPVRGPAKQELFQFLTEQGPADMRGEVLWNFEKFLMDRSGRLIGRWRSFVKPGSRSLVKAIEGALVSSS
jgi:glutathione peroxidase-family protein